MIEGYKQSEIGVIPEDWEVRFLTAFGDVVSGGTPSTSVSEYWDGDIAWCTPSDITKTRGTTISKTERCITAKGLFNSAAVLLPPGCVLLCSRATIGDSKINSVAMATNQGFKNIVPKNCNITFLFYLLQTKKQQMLEKAIGSTFLEISKSALCSIPMQYPPIPEQQRIAEALSDMDELISSLEKLVEKKKAIKQGVMQELLTGKRRLPGFSGEWEKTTVGRVTTTSSGGTPSREIKAYYEGNIPWITTSELQDCRIYDSKEHITSEAVKSSSAKIFPKGTVLMAMYGATIGKLGVLEIESTTNQACCALICNPSITTSFLYHYLCNLREYILTLGCGAGQPNISQGIVQNLPIVIPTPNEQEEICRILDAMDYEVIYLEKRLSKAKEVKQGLMQQLLTGRTRFK